MEPLNSYAQNSLKLEHKSPIGSVREKIKKTSILLMEQFLSFPCPGCGALVDDNWNQFCPDCCEKLQMTSSSHCRGCGGGIDGILDYCSKCLQFGARPWQNAYSIFEINQFGREMIHRYKYRNGVELARAFARLGAEKIRSTNEHFDVIVPVPLHWLRYLHRGYNQSQLFGLALQHELNIPMCNLLKRCRHTRRQASLNREARIKNLKNAFVMRNQPQTKGLSVLLIDDVFTTGSTLTEACRALPLAKVTVMTIGRR